MNSGEEISNCALLILFQPNTKTDLITTNVFLCSGPCKESFLYKERIPFVRSLARRAAGIMKRKLSGAVFLVRYFVLESRLGCHGYGSPEASPCPFPPGLPVLSASTRAVLTSNVPPAQHGNGREIPNYNSQMASGTQRQKKNNPLYGSPELSLKKPPLDWKLVEGRNHVLIAEPILASHVTILPPSRREADTQ